MNRKTCKECPWTVNNIHNNKFIEFIKKHNKKHNCHMLNKKMYDVNESQLCEGFKQQFSTFL